MIMALPGLFSSLFFHVCWSENSDPPFVYGFMSLDYGLGTMTTTIFKIECCRLVLISIKG